MDNIPQKNSKFLYKSFNNDNNEKEEFEKEIIENKLSIRKRKLYQILQQKRKINSLNNNTEDKNQTNQLSQVSILIQREGDNDIVDDDISISRNHAIFCYNKNEGKIYLKNKSKKFGSQVLIKKGFNLLDKKIHLQVGRTYIEAYRGIKEINNE